MLMMLKSHHILVVSLLLVVSAVADRLVNDQSFINSINILAPKWTAGPNAYFDGTLISEATRLCGSKRPSHDLLLSSLLPAPLSLFNDLPRFFDAREEWDYCPTIGTIFHQGRCGSCFAFAAYEVLQDRFCIQSGGSVKVELAPQDIVSCSTVTSGCGGGIPYLAWLYMKYSGMMTESCFPYTSGANATVPACRTQCVDGTTPVKYHAHSAYFVWPSAHSIQHEILAHGPVQAFMIVYEDFMNYQSGVYHHVTGEYLGTHTVKIVGWGEEADGTPYWTVANSWRDTWGENGFARVYRGRNECLIETMINAGMAKIN